MSVGRFVGSLDRASFSRPVTSLFFSEQKPRVRRQTTHGVYPALLSDIMMEKIRRVAAKTKRFLLADDDETLVVRFCAKSEIIHISWDSGAKEVNKQTLLP